MTNRVTAPAPESVLRRCIRWPVGRALELPPTSTGGPVIYPENKLTLSEWSKTAASSQETQIGRTRMKRQKMSTKKDTV